MHANAIVRIILYVRDIAKVAAFYAIQISSRGASARRANR
jgi:hypothetical protein